MIPKIIHYCWFGKNPIPQDIKNILETWEKYLPDFQIMCWNEDNFDINSNKFVKEAYESKKYAFVTDYVRLYALYNYGGIYMDTDVEVIKPLNKFLKYEAFTGKESNNACVTGTMGSVKGHYWIEKLLMYYEDKSFYDNDGMKTNTVIISEITKQMFGNTVISQESFTHKNLEIFAEDVFCAKNHKTGIVTLTPNTYTIHHFKGSWHSSKDRKKAKVLRILNNLLGENITNKIKAKLKAKEVKKC